MPIIDESTLKGENTSDPVYVLTGVLTTWSDPEWLENEPNKRFLSLYTDPKCYEYFSCIPIPDGISERMLKNGITRAEVTIRFLSDAESEPVSEEGSLLSHE